MLFLTTFDKLNPTSQIEITDKLFNIFTFYVMYLDLFEEHSIYINMNLLKVVRKVVSKFILDGFTIKGDRDTLASIAEINKLLKEKKTDKLELEQEHQEHHHHEHHEPQKNNNRKKFKKFKKIEEEEEEEEEEEKESVC